MVANTDQLWLRAHQLGTQILGMMDAGKRDAGDVARVFQAMKDDPKFARRVLDMPVLCCRVTLGLHASRRESHAEALRAQSVHIGRWAEELLFRVLVAPQKTSVWLACTTVEYLGFPNGARHKDVCARIQEWGDRLCPPEVALALLEQCRDQMMSKWMVIAMEPMKTCDAKLNVFTVDMSTKAQLFTLTQHGLGGKFYEPDRLVVFMLGN